MTILIIGSAQEAHAAFIHRKISDRGGKAAYFNTQQFPANTRLNLFCGPHKKGQGEIRLADEPSIPLESIEAVYWRYHMGFQLPPLNDSFLLQIAQREIESTVGSLFRMLPCRWVNSAEAIALHAYKPYQLQLMEQAGIRIPQTLISNDPEAVLAFYEILQGQVICKPVRGGTHTVRLTPDLLKREKLSELAQAPVQFQELIEGVDIRIYWMQGEVFAAEIQSQTLDFRDDPTAPIVPIVLPDAVIQDCQTIAQALGLIYTGIDVRRTPNDGYVFIEANPCPMFMHFENYTGYPISDRLVGLLMQG